MSLIHLLITSLPEALWAEATRRLQHTPALWDLAERQPALITTFAAAGVQLTDWRPASLALAAYALRFPESAPEPEAWLLGAGRERLSEAYPRLVSSEVALDPVADALPAALALRVRGLVTLDWQTTAADAAGHPERWQLPLQYLVGLLEDPRPLLAELLAHSPATAALTAPVLAANFEAEGGLAALEPLLPGAPAAHVLALAAALKQLGEPGLGRRVALRAAEVRPAPTVAETGAGLAYAVDNADLLAAGEVYATAQPTLVRAWSQVRAVRARLAAHLGHLALAAGDQTIALAAFQDALADQPDEPRLHLGLARTLLLMHAPERALEALEAVPTYEPERPLVTARAHLQLDQREAARAALMAAEPVDPAGKAEIASPEAAACYAEAAELWRTLEDEGRARAALLAAAHSAPGDAALAQLAGERLADSGDFDAAEPWAAQAAARRPNQPETRELLGRILLERQRPGEAIPHFQAALAYAPQMGAAALGLARAALATGQPQLACEAAGQVAASAAGSPLEGEAHILLGEAYSALQQEARAFEHFSRASSLMPAAPGPWRAMARHHQAQQEPSQAVATLEAGRQALKLAGSQRLGPLLLDLAEAYQAAGQVPSAIQALREAVEVDPRAFGALRQMGHLLRQVGQPREAVEALRQALRLRPGDWRALHELGLAMEALRQPAEAWAAFQQAVLARPEPAAPYFDLGRLTLQLQAAGAPDATPAQALGALREAVRRAPEHAEAQAQLAQALTLTGDPEGALAAYQRALHLAPQCTEWSLGLGQVCLQLGRPEVAVAALQEAVHHAPHDPRVHAAFAEAYLQSQLWAEAAHSAEAALKLDPGNVHLQALLARAAEAAGQVGRAAQLWEQAIALEPRNTALQISYARCLLGQDRAEEARSVLAHALALAPDSPEVHLAAGRAFLELGEVESAYETLTEAVALRPHQAAAHAALGEAALRAGHLEAAYAAYQRAAELEPARAEHLREAGVALQHLERTAAAVALWQRALTLNPSDPQTLAHLGGAWLRLGQPAEALAALEAALVHSPGDAGLARQAAQAAVETHNLERALAHLETALHLAPHEAEAHFLLGQVCEQQGEVDKALTFYQQAARLCPGDGRYPAASAEVLARQGQLHQAAGLMRQAVAISGENADLQRRAGQVYLLAGDLPAAALAFQRWVEAQPRHGLAHLLLAQTLVLAAERTAREAQAGARPTADAAWEARVHTELQQAAALGADPLAVRFWLARTRTLTGQAGDAVRLLSDLAPQVTAAAFPPADFYRALGSALRQAGQPEKAREALQAALEADGASALTLLEIGLTHFALNDPRGALVAFKRAVAAEPSLAVAHAHLAEALWQMGDGPQGGKTDAPQVLQRALALQPEVAAWHYRLAKWQQAHAEPGALAHFQKAAQIAPDNADYNADLARALLADGDMAGAVPFFRRATEARPEHEGLWAERGQAHLALGDYTSANEAFGKAVALAADRGVTFVAALLGAAQVSLALGNRQAALNQAETAVRAAPADANAHLCLAQVHAARGEAAAAEAHYHAAAEQAADPAPAWLGLGQLHFAQGRLPEATEALQQAVRANPNNEVALGLLGDVRAAAGDPALAVQAYREAARLAPRQHVYLLKLGRTLRAHGQLDQAIATLMQARELSPHHDETLREIGLAFEHRKQFDRALEMYQLAIRAAPRSAANYARAGVALKQLKDYAGSVNALERAVALDPNNLEATKQLAAVMALHIIHGDSRVRVTV